MSLPQLAHNPAKLVMEYSAAEGRSIRREYESRLQMYRTTGRLINVTATVCACVAYAAWLCSGIGAAAVCLLAGVPVVLGLLASEATVALPRCPGCDNAVDNELGCFCPECGGEVTYNVESLRLECAHCKRWLREGHGRNYRIRRCTSCGVLLDEQGF